MSIVLSLLTLVPKELVCCILDYDSRFLVRAGKIREISRLSFLDTRIKMLGRMMKERKLNLAWFDMEDWNDFRPQFVMMINRYDKYVLRIWDAEYVNEETGETVFEMTRELMILRGVRQIESVCEY
jgi:hypothetical protein